MPGPKTRETTEWNDRWRGEDGEACLSPYEVTSRKGRVRECLFVFTEINKWLSPRETVRESMCVVVS